MVQCTRCGRWQHVWCMGYAPGAIRDDHLCTTCDPDHRLPSDILDPSDSATSGKAGDVADRQKLEQQFAVAEQTVAACRPLHDAYTSAEKNLAAMLTSLGSAVERHATAAEESRRALVQTMRRRNTLVGNIGTLAPPGVSTPARREHVGTAVAPSGTLTSSPRPTGMTAASATPCAPPEPLTTVPPTKPAPVMPATPGAVSHTSETPLLDPSPSLTRDTGPHSSPLLPGALAEIAAAGDRVPGTKSNADPTPLLQVGIAATNGTAMALVEVPRQLQIPEGHGNLLAAGDAVPTAAQPPGAASPPVLDHAGATVVDGRGILSGTTMVSPGTEVAHLDSTNDATVLLQEASGAGSYGIVVPRDAQSAAQGSGTSPTSLSTDQSSTVGTAHSLVVPRSATPLSAVPTPVPPKPHTESSARRSDDGAAHTQSSDTCASTAATTVVLDGCTDLPSLPGGAEMMSTPVESPQLQELVHYDRTVLVPALFHQSYLTTKMAEVESVHRTVSAQLREVCG